MCSLKNRSPISVPGKRERSILEGYLPRTNHDTSRISCLRVIFVSPIPPQSPLSPLERGDFVLWCEFQTCRPEIHTTDKVPLFLLHGTLTIAMFPRTAQESRKSFMGRVYTQYPSNTLTCRFEYPVMITVCSKRATTVLSPLESV